MTVMTDYATADFYRDVSLVEDPHSYFDFLRAQGPVTRLPYRNVVAVTGYEETVQVMLDTEHFSSINAVTGPVLSLPFEPEGDDISGPLEAARQAASGSALDPLHPVHAQSAQGAGGVAAGYRRQPDRRVHCRWPG